MEPGDVLGQLEPVTLVEDVGCMAAKLSDVVVAGIQENSFKEKKNDCGVSDVVVAGIQENSFKEKKMIVV